MVFYRLTKNLPEEPILQHCPYQLAALSRTPLGTEVEER